MKKVTILSIASELKLSRNTVAKALVNSDNVSLETRREVITKAYEMGYEGLTQNVLADYITKDEPVESKFILIIINRDMSAFWNRIIIGITDELNKHKHKLQIYFVNDAEKDGNSLSSALTKEVDGIIVLSVFSHFIMKQLNDLKTSKVFLDAPVCRDDLTEGDVVYCESFYAIEKITADLIRRGMRKIGFIGDITYCHTINERYDGYLSAMRAAGLTPHKDIIANYHMPSRFYIKTEVEAAIEKFPYIPEAIVCANDDIALYAVAVLESKGLSVPNDVAVTGYDDLEMTLEKREPFLTTAKVVNYRLGKRLVQQLLWRIDNLDFPREFIVLDSVDVIFRKSSDKIVNLDDTNTARL